LRKNHSAGVLSGYTHSGFVPVVSKIQMMTIASADAARELHLKNDQREPALVNSTDVTIERLYTMDRWSDHRLKSPGRPGLVRLVPRQGKRSKSAKASVSGCT
jgi:hypothetical protein